MPKRLTDEERSWRTMAEKTLQSNIMALAREHGWKVNHFHNSQKMVRRGSGYKMVGDPDAKGFPDLVALRGSEIIFWELKRWGKDPTPDQQEWLDALVAGGFEARVIRPQDYESYVIPRLTGG